LLICYFACLLGSITCRMFRLYGESLNCRGSSLFTDNKTRSYCHRHLLSLLEYTEPIESNRLFISRFRTQGSRTRLGLMFTVSLSAEKQLRHVITFLVRYRPGGTPAIHRAGCVPVARTVVQRSRGSIGSNVGFPAPRVVETLLPGGF
jgi:hypothetical protein